MLASGTRNLILVGKFGLFYVKLDFSLLSDSHTCTCVTTYKWCLGVLYSPCPPQQFSTDGARIEAGFRKYFHRADVDQTTDSVEVIVCHANVIRYYVCRYGCVDVCSILRGCNQCRGEGGG